MRKHHYSSAQIGLASRFIRNFEGPYLVVRLPFSKCSDMLILRDPSTGEDLPHAVNVEQLTLSGPGGLRGPDGQTHSCQSETSYPMMPKLGDF